MMCKNKLFITICAMLFFGCNPGFAVRVYKKADIIKLREEVRAMFQHAYDSYLRYAYPYDELRPLSCDGVDTWGSYSLTLIDALDTLAIMGNHTEFNRVVDIVLQRKSFDADINVSVFETNIRIIGGLLSAHLLSHRTGMKLEPGWPCNGPLLRLAEDVAKRLIPAFDTTTGMPYGTTNFRSGVPVGETSVTCTAGVGTFIIEFGALSRLTGDPLYEEVAYNALKALYHHKSPIGLLGNHIDVMTGRWTAQDAGIGGGVDSYYEYLVKGAILLERPELMSMFIEARQSIERYLKKDDWFVWATMLRGHVTLPVFQSLEAYWPGLLSLIGESDTAMRIIHNYHSVWRQYGFTPEVYNLGTGEASASRESYPLRPELIESIMYLYRDTRDPILLQMGEDILRSIQHSARTPCGYATIKDVRDHRKEDRMESFFLAETTKYLYLLFDPDNFIHNPGVHGTVIDTPNGECVVDLGGYIFNTEAHPIDPTMLYCCHESRRGINVSEVHRVYQILEEEDNLRFMTMLEETLQKNDTNATDNTVQNKVEPNQVLIKTETRTGYVNIDGTERETINNEAVLNDNESTIKDRVFYTYYNSTDEASKEPDYKAQSKAIRMNVDDALEEHDYRAQTKAIRINADEALEEPGYSEQSKAIQNNVDEALEEPDYSDQSKTIRNNVDEALEDPDYSEQSKAIGVNVDEALEEPAYSEQNKAIGVNVDEALEEPAYSEKSKTSGVNVDDIIVAQSPEDDITLPSTSRTKNALKLLPKVIRDFLNNDWKTKPECEPQRMLERIRKEKRYPDHPDAGKYELLLTPAPSFLQRISLAGEFLNKKHLEL